MGKLPLITELRFGKNLFVYSAFFWVQANNNKKWLRGRRFASEKRQLEALKGHLLCIADTGSAHEWTGV